MASERDTIQNKLIDLAVAHVSFFKVTYGQNNKSTTETSNNNAPASFRCNETGRTHEPDENLKRRNARMTTEWTFDLILKWNTEVNLDLFIDSLEDPVPFIPASGNNRQIDLHLEAIEIQHPAQQQTAGGTKATFTFSAVPHRR